MWDPIQRLIGLRRTHLLIKVPWLGIYQAVRSAFGSHHSLEWSQVWSLADQKRSIRYSTWCHTSSPIHSLLPRQILKPQPKSASSLTITTSPSPYTAPNCRSLGTPDQPFPWYRLQRQRTPLDRSPPCRKSPHFGQKVSDPITNSSEVHG